MTFIIIILAWALVQHWGSATPVHNDDWFDTWRSWSMERFDQPLALVCAVVLIPAFAVFLLANLLDGVLFGLLYLALAVLTLLYAMGRGDFVELVAGFNSRWRRDDFQAAYHYATDEMGIDVSDLDESDTGELREQVKRAVLYRGYERWFAVIFYFLLAGIGGALLYRLLHLFAEREAPPEQLQIVETAIDALDWIPSRILAFAFALTGNFMAVVSPLLDSLQSVHEPIEDLLADCAHAALVTDSAGGAPESPERQVGVIDVQALLGRSAGAWIAAIAIATLLL